MSSRTSTPLPFDSDEELIIELVALPHWAALKRVFQRHEEGLKQKLCTPAQTFPDDFYRKEQWAMELRAYRIIFQEVENQAYRQLKKKRD